MKKNTLSRTTSMNAQSSDFIADGLSNANVAEQQIDGIIELREFDIPYHSRETLHFLNIIRYDVRVEQPELIILAFDFECTKMRLKFPTHASDQIKLRQKNQ
ncbi:unnamed protein product [Rotaria magnacalcarata]|uniref:Uncharacterized protein n=1 Tax=Rotaria magnacalcarata TaxID=392030 RepID=A0A815R0K7_9BILA|nr:unnamed protein product [Rotaria magnacalcarata]CAF1574849.1 unnamed protein product [Rotaria magnacalcarata]CAF3937112.1 unnamed protein product [Rotaria magnacalcarata]CAF3977929.1 unnamed protein product [Rotaria magnacalcarata]CAF4002716.1 unnamed protein product [Rotaria magnacalcarata]